MNFLIQILGIEHIEKLLKEEENATKQVVDIIIVKILNRRKYIYEKANNDNNTHNNIGRM